MFRLLWLFLLSAFLHGAELPARPYALVKQEIGKGQVVMIEAGSTMCRACREMGELLAYQMQRNPKRKIFFIDVAKERDAARAMKVLMIPTQIVYDGQGREIDRHVGGMSAQELKQFLAKHGI
ncbi:MAG: thioredoxin family protein [Campylobacterales bacterium]